MKKNKTFRSKNQVTRNTKRANKAKKRIQSRIVRTPELIKVQEHGPSETVTFDKDGKVKNWNSRSAHQHPKHSKACLEARNDIKLGKEKKKERIKQILKDMNYDPTIQYTRKEKKKFTRAVKDKLFKQKSKPWNKEEAIQRAKARAKTKKERLSALPHINEIKKQMEAILPTKIKTENKPIIRNERYIKYVSKATGYQMRYSAEEMQRKEKGKPRKFTFCVQRVREEDLEARKQGRPFRTYDFLTDHFEANTVIEAEKKLKLMSPRWEKDSSYTGIVLKDPEGYGMTTYYTLEKIKKIAA